MKSHAAEACLSLDRTRTFRKTVRMSTEEEDYVIQKESVPTYVIVGWKKCDLHGYEDKSKSTNT